MEFDIHSYLEDKDIQYWTEGKNVSPGWIGISCIFHNDHSNHLGINLKTKGFSCLSCHEKGSAVELVQALEDCTSAEAFRIIDQFREDGLSGQTNPPATQPTVLSNMVGPILPKTITSTFAQPHKEYLASRGFDPDYLIKKYSLHSCHTAGKYRFRIIIPFLLRGRIVSFTARDITGKAELRYRHLPNERSIVSRRDTFYNIDNIKGRTVIVVEGPVDVWRIGDGAIAGMGTEVTNGQINQLLKRGIKNIFVLFDMGASTEGETLARKLAGVFDMVEQVELVDEDDPGAMSDETSRQVRKLLA